MLTYGEAPLAYGMTRGMARAIGVDLVQAVTEGWMSREELGTLVAACAKCDHAARCLSWLAGAGTAPVLPAYCVNKSDLEALRG
jgi:hypothetical protein